MIELTIEDRNKVYRKARLMYSAVSPKYFNGLCQILEIALRNSGVDLSKYSIDPKMNIFDPNYHQGLEIYPEIMKHKPLSGYATSNGYWFPVNQRGIKSRIAILREAIWLTNTKQIIK